MEDFGELIYIGIAIIFSIVRAISKKKKKEATPVQQPVKESNSFFESFFDEEQEVDDPIQEQVAYEPVRTQPFVQLVEEEPEEIVEEPPVLEPLQQETVEVFSPSQEITVEIHAKPHPILNDIRQPQEVKKAILYSEILKPKF